MGKGYVGGSGVEKGGILVGIVLGQLALQRRRAGVGAFGWEGGYGMGGHLGGKVYFGDYVGMQT